MSEIITTRDSRVAKEMARVAELRQQEANWEALYKQEAGIHPPPRLNDSDERLLYHVLPDGSWKGKRCFIIGGGPSLRGFDFSRLQGELSIGVNRAFTGVDCTILFFMDRECYEWMIGGDLGGEVQRKFRAFKGFKVCLYIALYDYPRDIRLLRNTGSTAFTSSMRNGIGSGTNSGYAALNLAVCLGANPIYLLGFDMSGSSDGKWHWWHGAYPQRPMTTEKKVYRKFMQDFERVAPELKSRDVRVVNLNRQSALQCFEFGDFDDIIRKDSKK